MRARDVDRRTVGSVALGTGVLVLAGVLALLPMLGTAVPAWALGGMSISPLLASLVASWTAPKRKIAVGTAMVVPALVVTLLVNGAYQLRGMPVDFGGVRGARILAGITVAWNLPACFIVAALVSLGFRWARKGRIVQGGGDGKNVPKVHNRDAPR